MSNPLFPQFSIRETSDAYEWVLFVVALIGFTLNSWLWWRAYQDTVLAKSLVQSPRLRFVAYTHFRQGMLAWLIQVVLLTAGSVALGLPSPVLLLNGLPGHWIYQSIVRNVAMIAISLLTTVKAWFNWRDQVYLLRFVDFDQNLFTAIEDVKQHAQSAYHEANNVNLKLATMSEHIEKVQQQTTGTLENIANGTETIKEVADETLSRVTQLQKDKGKGK